MRFRDPEAAALYFRNKPGTARQRLTLAEHGFSLRYRDPSSPLEARAEVALVGPILAQIGIPEDSQEVRLLHKILASSQPGLEQLCELSRLLYAQRKFWVV